MAIIYKGEEVGPIPAREIDTKRVPGHLSVAKVPLQRGLPLESRVKSLVYREDGAPSRPAIFEVKS